MPAENAGRAFALVLVDELVRHGVRHAVIAPGSRSTPIALALIENAAVTVHVRVDERSAGFLALGIAKASEHPAIVPVLCTSGTAVAHFHAAVLEADLARVPLLVLTADRPPELRGIGANQTIDQVGLYGAAVRWSCDVAVPESLPDSVRSWRAMVSTAAAHLLGGEGNAPGPVHLNLPLREPLTPTDDGVGFPFDLDLGQPAVERPKGTSTGEQFTGEVAAEIAKARQGVIVVGGNAGEVEPIERFAVRAGWPVIAEPHSNARGIGAAMRGTDVVLRDPDFAGSHQADFALVVGRVGLSRTLLGWLAQTPHIVVAPDGGPWDVTRSARQLVHLPTTRLDAMFVTPADPSWRHAWLRAAEDAGAAIDGAIDGFSTLTEPQVARDVADLVPDGGALVVASSMPIRDLDLTMRPRAGLSIFANRGVSGIDGFVSTAMGVALGRWLDGPTVALCGDLSLLHDINGLMPGPDPRPDISFVVIDNNGGGIFSVLPQWRAVDPVVAERIWGTPHHMSIEKVAAAYQADYTLVSTAGDLKAALSSHGGVRIIEVRTDRGENAALHERLRAITVGGG